MEPVRNENQSFQYSYSAKRQKEIEDIRKKYLPKEEESKMKWRPGHIYMGGMLRQAEFQIVHTSQDRVRDIVGKK